MLPNVMGYKTGGGAREVLPLRKRGGVGADKYLAMLKEGGGGAQQVLG